MIAHADCLDWLPTMEENSIDSCVTDPPYMLGFMGKAFDKPEGNIAADPVFWQEAYRVLKPGAYLLAFGGTRTQHRLVCAIEDAGFEIRDTITFLYGVGFPKSKAIGCKCGGGMVPYSHEIQSQDMPGVREGVDSENPIPGDTEQVLLDPVRQQARPEELAEGGPGNGLHGLREDVSPAAEPQGQGEGADLLQGMQRKEPGAASGEVQREHEGQEEDGCALRPRQPGVEGRGDVLAQARELQADQVCAVSGGVPGDGKEGRVRDGAPPADSADDGKAPAPLGSSASQEPRSPGQPAGEPRTFPEQSGAQEDRICPKCGGLLDWVGYGTALKPAVELVCVARKPLSEKTVAANVLRWGTGAINVDGCRVGTTDNLNGGAYCAGEERRREEYSALDGVSGAIPMSRLRKGLGEYQAPSGRWPANLVLDEDAAAMMDEVVGELKSGHLLPGHKRGDGPNVPYGGGGIVQKAYGGDTGGPSRFFYCAKASRREREAGCEGLRTDGGNPVTAYGARPVDWEKADWKQRNGNHHPTVKPLSLMRWLCRLVTPPGGTVLDPFAGSGSTLIAAGQEGFDYLGCEKDEEYVAIAEARLAHWLEQPALAEVAG